VVVGHFLELIFPSQFKTTAQLWHPRTVLPWANIGLHNFQVAFDVAEGPISASPILVKLIPIFYVSNAAGPVEGLSFLYIQSLFLIPKPLYEFFSLLRLCLLSDFKRI
jgi:hypothetical protein